MYKGVSKDQRDKVQLMATEKKLRSEIDELRNQMKKIQVKNFTERKINANIKCYILYLLYNLTFCYLI